MFRDILVFIIGKITSHNYICDKCQDEERNYMTIGLIEYVKNQRNNCHYCTWCWNYINLKKWACGCGNSGTLRSSHQSLITCTNCYGLVKCQDGTNFSIYLNGILKDTGTSTTARTPTYPTVIGRMSNSGNEDFNGQLEGIRFSNVKRSTPETIARYNAEKENSDFVTTGTEVTQ